MLYEVRSFLSAPSENVAYFTSVIRTVAVAQRLRCCATNRKAAGSIPVGFIGIFH